nr:putative reverse transcriptase domain-containing protein [Tanacetum cinerariifolium]
MDEIDQKNKDAKKAKSPYDTKSKIKIIKSFQAAAVYSLLVIYQGSQRSTSDDLDVIDITSKYDNESDASDSVLREFNAFNTLESFRFVKLQQELSKVIKTKMGVSVKNKVRKGMKDMVSLLKIAKIFEKANVEGEKWEKNNLESLFEEKYAQNPDQTKGEQHLRDTIMAIARREQPPAQVVSNIKQAPPINEENSLVLYASMEKSSKEDTSNKKVTNDEPPVKKLKFLILSPTPLKSIMPEPLQKPDATKMTMD